MNSLQTGHYEYDGISIFLIRPRFVHELKQKTSFKIYQIKTNKCGKLDSPIMPHNDYFLIRASIE